MKHMNHTRHFLLCVSQLILLVLGLGTFTCSWALVPVESVTNSNAQYPSNSPSSTSPVEAQTSTIQNNTAQGSANSDQWVGQLLNQVNSLQQQVQQLKGQLEEQQYLLKQFQEKSRQQYLDLDRRFSQLVSTGSANNIKNSGITPTPSINHQNSALASANLNDVQAYNNAFKLVGEKKFSQAIDEFQQFIQHYPKSKYIANAWYWLGEIYSVSGETEQSKAAFLKIIAQYPNSNKAADSMYKLGQIYAQNGDINQAKKFLQMAIVKDKNNGSGTTARLAQSFLDSLK